MARQFDDGSSQYLSNANAVVSGVPLTMACWFNSDDATIAQVLMAVVDYSGTHGHWLHILGQSPGDVVRATTSGTGGYGNADTSSGYSADTWHHGAAVFAADNDRRVYIDGGSKGTNSTNTQAQNLDYTYIGVYEYSSGSFENYMSGAIAEAAIWDAALDDDEIADLAAGMSPLLVRPQSLVCYLPLIRDDDEDLVGGVSFTANGGPTVSTHAPVIYGGAIHVGLAAEVRRPRNPAHYNQLFIY